MLEDALGPSLFHSPFLILSQKTPETSYPVCGKHSSKNVRLLIDVAMETLRLLASKNLFLKDLSVRIANLSGERWLVNGSALTTHLSYCGAKSNCSYVLTRLLLRARGLRG